MWPRAWKVWLPLIWITLGNQFPWINTGYADEQLGLSINHIARRKRCITNEDVTLGPRSFHLWLWSCMWTRPKISWTFCTHYSPTGSLVVQLQGLFSRIWELMWLTEWNPPPPAKKQKWILCFHSEISFRMLMYSLEFPVNNIIRINFQDLYLCWSKSRKKQISEE